MRRLFFLLYLAVVAAASPAHAAWREASSPHFVIYSEQSEKSLREFAESLERYDKGLRLLYGLPDEQIGPANRLTVYVVSNMGAVQKLARVKRSSFGVAGFYLGRAHGSLAIVPRSTGSEDFGFDANLVLQHEYAHHFLSRNFAGSYPAWFMEGFAELGSTAERQKGGAVGFGLPAQHRAYTLLRGRPLPIEQLLSPPEKMKAEQIDGLYARGWLLTHYLTFDSTRDGQLNKYLARLRRGEDTLEAARAEFGDLKQLDKELDKYLKQSTLAYLRVPPEKLPIGQVTVRQLDEGEDAIMSVRIRSKVGVTRDEAIALVPEARKSAAPYAGNVAVQVALAEAEYDAGNLAEAEAAADRALSVNPKSLDALLYKGRVRLALAAQSDEADVNDWKDARKLLAAANRVDPDDPEPLIDFYQSFQIQGIKPTENAAIGLERAFELAPEDMGLRMNVAFHLLSAERPSEARSLLQAMAYHPHGGGMSLFARDIIAAIDKGGAKEALAQWQKGGSEPGEEKKASGDSSSSSPDSSTSTIHSGGN